MALGIKRIMATPYDPQPQPPHLSGHLDQIAYNVICTAYHLPTNNQDLVNNSTNSLCSHDWNGKNIYKICFRVQFYLPRDLPIPFPMTIMKCHLNYT
jgi:hypothetical protein